MDPRLIELNPRIEDAAEPATARHQATTRLAEGRSTDTSIAATLAGTRKQVGRWLVGLGTALEGGPQGQPAGTARR